MTHAQEAVINRIKQMVYPIERAEQIVIYSGYNSPGDGTIHVPLTKHNGDRLWVIIRQDGRIMLRGELSA